MRRARLSQRGLDDFVRAAPGRDVVPHRKLEANEILENGRHPSAPALQIKLLQIHTIKLDGPTLRVVQPAQQLGQSRLAGAILTNNRQGRTRRNRQIKSIQHWLAGVWISETQCAKTNFTCW